MPRHYKQAFSERPAPWNYKKEEALSGLRRWARLTLPSNSFYFRISKKIQFSYLIFFPNYKLEFFCQNPIRSLYFLISEKFQFGHMIFLSQLQN